MRKARISSVSSITKELWTRKIEMESDRAKLPYFPSITSLLSQEEIDKGKVIKVRSEI